MSVIHISGMGWLGSALALRLDRAGVSFTWSDIDAEVQSWRASTGLVYPAGDLRSQDNLARWRGWVADGFLPAGSVEQVDYVYSHKAPPHGGRYEVRELVGGLRVAQAPCYSVNVPAIVRHARSRFADRRSDGALAAERLVVARGFTDRLSTYMWGWAAPVHLDLPADYPQRPALYGRPHRFQMVYAYPLPGTGQWLAGSSLVAQKTPVSRPHNALSAFERWMEAFPRVYPRITVTPLGPPVEGWRPRPSTTDTDGLRVAEDDTLTFPPLWHSGVRWAPELVDDAVARLT